MSSRPKKQWLKQMTVHSSERTATLRKRSVQEEAPTRVISGAVLVTGAKECSSARPSPLQVLAWPASVKDAFSGIDKGLSDRECRSLALSHWTKYWRGEILVTICCIDNAHLFDYINSNLNLWVLVGFRFDAVLLLQAFVLPTSERVSSPNKTRIRLSSIRR